MNGRVYDYNIGRFMSVDPFIQEPGNSQSINPYSYIMNNPLGGTDPSGYIAITPEQAAKIAIWWNSDSDTRSAVAVQMIESADLQRQMFDLGQGLTSSDVDEQLEAVAEIVAISGGAIAGAAAVKPRASHRSNGSNLNASNKKEATTEIESQSSATKQNPDKPLNVYHRKESPTQTPDVAKKMEESGELWGRSPRGSETPQPQAYKGPLKDGERGVEFTTTARTDDNQPPSGMQNFRNPDDVERFVTSDGEEMAKIKITVTKNTQTERRSRAGTIKNRTQTGSRILKKQRKEDTEKK